MSFRPTSTPAVTKSPVATSPQYNMSGVANEVNASRSRKGYLSTFFGRTEKGKAERNYNSIFQRQV
jgi:hypothetical protein